jgi:hypothetical protein
MELEKFDTTNPPHVFEIHPLIKLDAIDVTGSFTLPHHPAYPNYHPKTSATK